MGSGLRRRDGFLRQAQDERPSVKGGARGFVDRLVGGGYYRRNLEMVMSGGRRVVVGGGLWLVAGVQGLRRVLMLAR